jgi:hypothetical protein
VIEVPELVMNALVPSTRSPAAWLGQAERGQSLARAQFGQPPMTGAMTSRANWATESRRSCCSGASW